ncbi:hypothetical protein EVAR_77766_1 [Eumeta japonica]|uniref:Uncharacterized protein n=1 Tax=Eumeta variegata TaxID=151549 RepID=A0A4C1TAW3_EUMVA|nr:hypothetical protein EVAR_77766_1 [Eumeta japonica]
MRYPHGTAFRRTTRGEVIGGHPRAAPAFTATRSVSSPSVPGTGTRLTGYQRNQNPNTTARVSSEVQLVVAGATRAPAARRGRAVRPASACGHPEHSPFWAWGAAPGRHCPLRRWDYINQTLTFLNAYNSVRQNAARARGMRLAPPPPLGPPGASLPSSTGQHPF